MKKILIVVLMVIPLIIAAAINLTTSIIPPDMKPQVESIQLLHNGREIQTEQIDVVDYLRTDGTEQGYYRIDATVLPSIAVQTVFWTSDAPDIAYVDYSENDTSVCRVYFTGEYFGEAVIKCQSTISDTYSSVKLFVTGSKVIALELSVGEDTGSTNIGVGDRVQIGRRVIPAMAIRDKLTEWTSSNQAVATVDDNGVVTAISNGSTVITAAVQEGAEVISSTITVNVGAMTALSVKDEYVVGGNSIDLTSYINGTLSLSSSIDGVNLSGNTITYSGSGRREVPIVVTNGDNQANATVTFTGGTNELEFINLDILLNDAWEDGAVVGIGALDYALIAEVANVDYVGTAPTITYTISNTAVLSIVEGRLNGLTAGTATLTASAAGYTSCDIEIMVAMPISSFSLNLDNRNDNRGIEGTVVFGNKFAMYTATGINLLSTYQLSYTYIYPENATPAFDYVSDNEAFATVDEEGLVTFHDAAIDNQVTISVYAKYTYSGDRVRQTYTFTVVDAVNIGYDVDASKNTVEDPNFDVYFMFYDVVKAEHNVVLHSDVYYPSPSEGGSFITINTDLYGNGYTIDGTHFFNTDWSVFLAYYNFPKVGDLIKLRNVNFKGVALPEDGSWDWLRATDSFGINVSCPDQITESGTRTLTVDMKYCSFQLIFTPTFTDNGHLIADGCLFVNTVAGALMVQCSGSHYPIVTVRNCIASNSIAPPIFVSENMSNAVTDSNRYAKIYIEGENYIYNWKRIKDLSFGGIIRPKDLGGNANLANTINTVLDTQVQKMFTYPEYDVLKIEATGDEVGPKFDWFNLCIVSCGMWSDASNFTIEYDDTKWARVLLDMAKTDFGGEFGQPSYLITNTINGKANTLPDKEYTDGSVNGVPLYILRLRGEA